MSDQPRNVRELAGLVRDAATRSAATRDAGLRIEGAGTWMDSGHPVRAGVTLSVGAMRGIVAYTPADLTITVDAATTLAELDAATREHGQWCPLLPWGDDRGTVGATVATATAGPFAESLGRPRDLVLGVEAVDGMGRVLGAGGRVVKNVAGFDLTRAITGSWGTLAVIARLHLRLRSRPAVDESWAMVMDDARDTPGGVSRNDPGAALREFSRGPHAPLAMLDLAREDAAALALPAGTRALVRIGGNGAFVAASRAALQSTAGATAVAVEPATWDRVRTRLAPGDRALTWRWDALSRRLRERFDPARVLNPGLLGEEG
ncbi:MAG: FAD-binding protein [Gemmatimonadota bacterium]|nr:FAD-binding protein [Gemmatimonadota bacterium]